MRRVLTLVVAYVLLGVALGYAVPEMINYQGRLTDLNDQPVTGTVNITFTIYGSAAGADDKWTEDQTGIPVADGLFNVLLGSVNPIDPSVFDGNDRWLQVTVDGEVIAPRHRLVSVGYAMTANNLEGVVTVDTPTGNVGIGDTTPTERLDVDGNIRIANSGVAALMLNNSPSNSWEARVFGGDFSLRQATPVPTDRLTITDDGNVGIGTTSPNAQVEINGAADSNRLYLRNSADANKDIRMFHDASGNPVIAIHSTVNANHRLDGGGDSYFAVETGNVGIGTTSPNYKLEVSGAVMMEDAATTPTAVAGHSGIFSSGGELFAIDSAGNSTLTSPHDKETGEWIFYSKNVKTGRVVRVNMEKLVKKIEELTGEKFIEEWIE